MATCSVHSPIASLQMQCPENINHIENQTCHGVPQSYKLQALYRLLLPLLTPQQSPGDPMEKVQAREPRFYFQLCHWFEVQTQGKLLRAR